MSTDLVYRMRTCAAFIASRPNDAPMPTERLLDDAADLLLEASNLLDVPEPLGEPMEMVEVAALAGMVGSPGVAVWGGDLPIVKARPCPSCGSVDARSVRRVGRQLMLTCPVCSASWEYGKHGA